MYEETFEQVIENNLSPKEAQELQEFKDES